MNNDINNLEEKYNKLESEFLKLREIVDRIDKDFYVNDFLVLRGEAISEKIILKSEAKSFKYIYSVDGFFTSQKREYCFLAYTSQENYDNHKPLIDKLEKKAEEFENKEKTKTEKQKSK